MTVAAPFHIAGETAERRREIVIALLVAAAVAVAAVVINPIGYVGAGTDDEHYLAAARCWLVHGAPCAPTNHWSTRWPAFALIAASIHLFGESRFTVGIGPALWWALALLCLGYVGSRWFGWRAGAIAAALLGTTPMFAVSALDPTADVPELAFQLAALAAATIAYRRQRAGFAVVAGVLAGLALQARETSFLFFAASALVWFRLDGRRRTVLLWAIAGVAVPVAAEMVVYTACSGEPFERYRLALRHTSIATAELPQGFHSARGPLLNPDYMRSWKRTAGMTLWWPIDPWLNLLASPRSMTVLWTGLVALALLGRRLRPAERRRVVSLMLGATVVVIGLVYVLAVDPKPRTFMGLYAAVALASGAAISRGLKSDSRLLAGTLLVVPVALGLRIIAQYLQPAHIERQSLQWIQRMGTDIEVDRGAASLLALQPRARALPPRGSGRRYLLALSTGPCERLIDQRPGYRNGRVVARTNAGDPQAQGMCLLEYLPVRPSERR